jgi:hypothetical protein
MTPQELALLLAPQVREAAEHAKPDILSNLQPMKRVFVKAIWNMAMKDGVPAANRIIIEFLVAKYRAELEPLIGEVINLVIKSMDEENMTPQMQLLHDILSVLRTPESQFHPAVQQCFNPMISHALPDYDQSED